jgi:cell division protein FtsL
MTSCRRFAQDYQRFALIVLTVVATGAAFFLFVNSASGAELTAEPSQHVVGAHEIQARIDQQIDQVDADRRAVQALLQRADVRRIAGAAGLDLERASAAAATLSGTALESLASQARALDTDLVGGDSKVVLTTTTIIIILLILILLT